MKTLYRNGLVHTMDGACPFAGAFLVENGFFTAVGGEELSTLPHDEEIDLKGYTVLPGLGDSHLHLLHLGRVLSGADVSGLTGLAAVQETIRRHIDEKWLLPGEWVEAHGFNQDLFDIPRVPDRYDLDAVSTEHPIVLERVCGHMAVCNSRALELLGITAGTPQPAMGAFEIKDGSPNGVFLEYAVEMLHEKRPAPTLEQLKNWLRIAMAHARSKGLTFVCSEDFESTPHCDWRLVMQAYRELEQAGEMPLRVTQQCILPTMEKLRQFLDAGHRPGQGGAHYRTGPLKLLADGSLGARTALLRQDYADEPGNRGIGIYTQRELTELVCAAHKAGMHAAVHAIGDGAIEMVLNAIEQAQSQPGPAPVQPHGIIHCQITDKALLRRIGRLGAQVYAQPVFLEYDLHMAESRVGALAVTSYAWNTLAGQGTLVSGGSDCPVEPLDPLLGIACAVTRQDLDGDPDAGWYAQECVNVETALQFFTVNAAKAAAREDLGRIAPGFRADFVVLDKDPFACAKAQLRSLQVLGSVCGGM